MARLFVRVVPRDRTKKHTANLRPAADLFAPRITATCISFAEMRWIIARKVYRSCVPLRFSKGQVLLAWAIALQLLSLGRPVRILRRSVSFGRSDSTGRANSMKEFRNAEDRAEQGTSTRLNGFSAIKRTTWLFYKRIQIRKNPSNRLEETSGLKTRPSTSELIATDEDVLPENLAKIHHDKERAYQDVAVLTKLVDPA